MTLAMTTKPTVLVTGASGLLGRGIMRVLTADDSFHVVGAAFSRAVPPLEKVDLTDETDTIRLLKKINPSVIIHAAAERRPDIAEKNEAATIKLNVEATRTLSTYSTQTDTYLIYISTDYVFDGTCPPYTTVSKPNPLNMYGHTKHLGEQVVLTPPSSPLFSCVLRIPILYGTVTTPTESAITTLINTVTNTVKTREVVWMDGVQKRYPTHVDDVGKALQGLLHHRYDTNDDTGAPTRQSMMETSGIFHFSAKHRTTKYDLCLVISRLLHIDTTGVICPVSDTNVGDAAAAAAAKRPMDARLDTSRIESIGVRVDCVNVEQWLFDTYSNKRMV